MSKTIAESIAGLSNKEFAEELEWLRNQIEIDPMENFIEHPLFMNFKPTPAQRVALKTIFQQKLDDESKFSVWMESKDSSGNFDLTPVPMTETEIYEYMTNQEYDVTQIKLKNKINFIIGRRGGKCQHIDSLITLADGSRVRIGDLIDKEFEVMAYDEATGKAVKSRGRGIDNGVKEVFRVITRSGQVLERTGNHPLMTEQGWATIETGGLKVGSFLQTPRVNAIFGEESLFTEAELKLLGYLIGDGSLSSGNFGYTQLPNACSLEFVNIIESLGGAIRTTQKEGARCKTYHPRSVPEVRKLLKRVGLWGKRSPEKTIPSDIFKSPKADVALFLNRLFSTDGSFYEKSPGRIAFGYTSASLELATGVKHLAQRFGVVLSLQPKEVTFCGKVGTYWRLNTSDSSMMEVLINEIGALGKTESLTHTIKMSASNHPANLIPKYFWERLELHTMGMTDSAIIYGAGHRSHKDDSERVRRQYAPSREKYLKYLSNSDAPETLRNIVEHFWFDEIVAIESIGLAPTAGIEVDIHHTYINDVVEHNTTLAAMLAVYCAIITNWKPYLQKTPFATVLVLSHSREFSDEVLEIIRTFIESSPVLKRVINLKKKNTASTMNLSVPFFSEDRKLVISRVQIKVGAASSKTTRGIASCAVICDEIAFWNLDENMKETDEKIMKAVRPATKQFGRKAILIKISSPGIKQGVLFKEYQRWNKRELPSTYTVFKAPSWVWNTILPKEEFVEEWELDQDGFDTEYRANFVDSLSNFILPEFVDMAVVKGTKFQPPEAKRSQVVYRAAIDAAFKKDHFTISVVGHFENRLKQYIIKGWKGSKKKPVSAKDVAEYARTICREYGIDEVAADQYSFEPLREIFAQYGVTLVEKPFSLTFKKQIYFNLKRLIHSQQIDLLDSEELVKEIKELVIEQTGSGQIRIGHPPGGSDDYSDSTAIASYLAVESAGQVGYDFQTSIGREDYGVKIDVSGKTFVAPPPELLAESFGYSVRDNSKDYVKDPLTGRLKRIEEDDEEDFSDEDDGPQFIV